MNVLITAGATREPLDEVRFISNVSTGATGAALAAAFVSAGHRVTLLRGVGAVRAAPEVEEEVFSSAADLRERLRRRLGTGDVALVVMAAAVADYRPANAQAGKISSGAERLTVDLVRNPKLLPALKSFSSQPLRVVGFKLTVGASDADRRAAVAAQFAAGGVDLVVHNDLAEIRAAGHGAHPFAVYRAATAAPVLIVGVPALAEFVGRGLLAGDPGAPIACKQAPTT